MNRLSKIKARFARRETGRHRAEPERRWGVALFILGTIGLVFTTIITAFIVQGSPVPPLGPAEYHPSSPAVIPQPVVFPPWKQEVSPPRTYTVKAGDTLWEIAFRECGNGLAWDKLQHENGINPWWLGQGQVLKISC